MLGTGNAMVTRCYNTCFVLRNQEDCLLVDAGGGNGILAQMEKAGIPFENVHAMFVSPWTYRPCARCDMGRTQNFGDDEKRYI